jgi:hypothetical protein
MRVSIIVFAFVVASALARQADACTCASGGSRPLGPNEVLFEATVDAIEVFQPPPPEGYKVSPGGTYVGGRTHIVRLKDIKAVQGEPKDTVSTSAFEASCGYTFKVGQRYLIHAHKVEGRLGVSYCGMTKPLAVKIGG